jgi:hypothetical protein
MIGELTDCGQTGVSLLLHQGLLFRWIKIPEKRLVDFNSAAWLRTLITNEVKERTNCKVLHLTTNGNMP